MNKCLFCGTPLPQPNKKRIKYCSKKCGMDFRYKKNRDKIIKRSYDYYYNHFEEIAAKSKEYYIKNKEKIKKYKEEYREKNKEKIRIRKRKYYLRVERFNEKLKKRRIIQQRIRRQTVKGKAMLKIENKKRKFSKHLSYIRKTDMCPRDDLKKELIKNLKKQTKCFYCGKKCKLIIEHIFPISIKSISYSWNFVMACGSCNNIKRDKNPFEWQNICQKRLPDEFVRGLYKEYPVLYNTYFLPFDKNKNIRFNNLVMTNYSEKKKGERKGEITISTIKEGKEKWNLK